MINFKTIIHKVSNKTNVPLYKVHKVISLTFKEIDRLIRKKENILLRGFMKFVTSRRSDYKKPNKLSINQIVKFPNKPKQLKPKQ